MSRLLDRERGARSAALTLAGLGYTPAIRGMSFGNAASKTKTETLTDLIRVRGLWFYLLRYWLLLNRRRMGHVAAEFLSERLKLVKHKS